MIIESACSPARIFSCESATDVTIGADQRSGVDARLAVDCVLGVSDTVSHPPTQSGRPAWHVWSPAAGSILDHSRGEENLDDTSLGTPGRHLGPYECFMKALRTCSVLGGWFARSQCADTVEGISFGNNRCHNAYRQKKD